MRRDSTSPTAQLQMEHSMPPMTALAGLRTGEAVEMATRQQRSATRKAEAIGRVGLTNYQLRV